MAIGTAGKLAIAGGVGLGLYLGYSWWQSRKADAANAGGNMSKKQTPSDSSPPAGTIIDDVAKAAGSIANSFGSLGKPAKSAPAGSSPPVSSPSSGGNGDTTSPNESDVWSTDDSGAQDAFAGGGALGSLGYSAPPSDGTGGAGD